MRPNLDDIIFAVKKKVPKKVYFLVGITRITELALVSSALLASFNRHFIQILPNPQFPIILIVSTQSYRYAT